jgi:hypothetical protein
MLDAGRLLTAGELGLDRKLGRGTSKQETLTTFLQLLTTFLQLLTTFCKETYIPRLNLVFIQQKFLHIETGFVVCIHWQISSKEIKKKSRFVGTNFRVALLQVAQFHYMESIDFELLITRIRTTATAHCSTSVLTWSAGAGQQCHALSPTRPAGGHTGLALPSCSWWSQVPTR